MHIDIERLNEDPKVAKEFLEDELQKAEREEMRELLWIGHIATLFVHNQMRLKAET